MKMTTKQRNQVRFSIGVPISVAIKMDMYREKGNISRSNWITQAITQKIKSEENLQQDHDELKKLRSEVNELKELVKN